MMAMIPTTPVDRCVCHQIAFSSLIPLIESLRADGAVDEAAIFKQLTKDTNCATGCSMCRPYIRRVIQTGQTRFSALSSSHE